MRFYHSHWLGLVRYQKEGTARKAARQLCFSAGLFLIPFCFPRPASADLPIQLSTTYSDPTQVYVTFQTTFPDKFSASYMSRSGTKVQIKVSPSSHLSPSIVLSDIKDGTITLSKVDSGLIYASLGGPLGQAAPPDPRNPSDPAYHLAWQNLTEITYLGAPPDSGNMTSINLFGVPCDVSVFIKQNTQLVEKAGFVVSESDLISKLMSLSTTPRDTTIRNSSGEVVRVLSPNSFGYSTNNLGTHYFSIAGYPSFEEYVKSVHDAHKKTIIKGTLGPGNFNFVSEVNDALDIVTTGNYGTGVTYTITIPHDYMLTDGSGLVNYVQSSALYLCPTAAKPETGVTVTSSNGSPIDPAELAQVLHDLTSGYNFGFINSSVIDPVTKKPFGDEPSSNWFVDSTKDSLYKKLQPDHAYYNRYSEVISEASDGSVYGFPYADAVPGVTLNTVKYPGTNPPSDVSGWQIVIGPPASP
jgi:hypothetical protein